MGIIIPNNGYISTKMNWDREASNDLKAEITRRGLTYAQVVARLADAGVKMTPHAFTKKVNRGGFSHAFFLKCVQALGSQNVSPPYKADTTEEGAHHGH